ncbi:hypothetical protein FACS189492_2390 [Clostridia bacterium]|nr:hypothetical protein FACS189492_2390 [Clostridia bacterium]
MKKLRKSLCVLLAICLCAVGAVAAEPAIKSPGFEVESSFSNIQVGYPVYMSGGARLTALTGGSVIDVTVPVNRTSAAAVTVAVALYQSGGKLLKISSGNIASASGFGFTTVNMTLPSPLAEGSYLKTFVWNSYNLLTPVTGGARFPQTAVTDGDWTLSGDWYVTSLEARDGGLSALTKDGASGTAAQKIGVETQSKYEVTFWSKGAASFNYKVTNEGGTKTLGGNQTVTAASDWTKTTFAFTTTTETAARLVFTATAAGEAYIDDIQVKSATSNLLDNPGFEAGIEGWERYASSKIDAVTDPVHSGSQAGRVHTRTFPWHGIAQDVTEKLTASKPGNYYVEAWVRTNSPTNVTTTVKFKMGDVTKSIPGAAGQANNAGWLKISAEIYLDWTGTLPTTLLYIEQNEYDPLPDLYVDDCILRKAEAPSEDDTFEDSFLVTNGNFEADGAGTTATGWDLTQDGRYNNISVVAGASAGGTSTDAYRGGKTLRISAELFDSTTPIGGSASQTITGLKPNTHYALTFLARTTANMQYTIYGKDASGGFTEVFDRGSTGTTQVSTYSRFRLVFNSYANTEMKFEIKNIDTRTANIWNSFFDEVRLYEIHNLLVNPSFESGVTGWVGYSNGKVSALNLAVDGVKPRFGNGAAKVSGRAQGYNGIMQVVTEQVKKAGTGRYLLYAWLSTGTSTQMHPFGLKMSTQATGNDQNVNQGRTFANALTVEIPAQAQGGTTWLKGVKNQSPASMGINSGAAVWTGDLLEARIYVEQNTGAENADMYIDEVLLCKIPDDLTDDDF